MRTASYALAPIVLTLSLIATLCAWILAEQYSHTHAKVRFDTKAQQLIDGVETRIDEYALLIQSGLPIQNGRRQGQDLEPGPSENQRFDDLLSVVAAALRAGGSMDDLLGEGPEKIRLQVFDESDNSANTLLYDSFGITSDTTGAQKFVSDQFISFYSHTLGLKASAGNTFLSPAESLLSILTVSGGVISSLLLSFATFLLTRQQQAATQIANRMIREATESEHRFRHVVNATDTGMLIIDKAGKIIMANRAVEAIFGCPEAELIGEPLSHLIPDYQSALECGSITQEANSDLVGRHRNGDQSPIEIRLTPMLNPSKTGLSLATITDISERKAKEAQSQAMMAELERSNTELAQFAHASSHDLKAPLRAIDNLAQWINDDTHELLPPESKRHLSLMRKRVQRMEQLLDDLLVYGRVGTENTVATPVELNTMLSEIAELVNPQGDFKICLDADNETLVTHRTPLFHVLLNLIGNAIKHHDKTLGVITIRSRSDTERVKIEVSDDGPGIEPANQERIFQMYQTLKPRDQVEGSGMGLATARKIVNGFGGQLSIANTDGPGASFAFDMPTFENTTQTSTQPADVSMETSRNHFSMAEQS